jgi:hypothetical protein
MIDASKLPTVPREVAQAEGGAEVDQVEYASAPEALGNQPSAGRPPATQRNTR